jgi:hypothetical protein
VRVTGPGTAPALQRVQLGTFFNACVLLNACVLRSNNFAGSTRSAETLFCKLRLRLLVLAGDHQIPVSRWTNKPNHRGCWSASCLAVEEIGLELEVKAVVEALLLAAVEVLVDPLLPLGQQPLGVLVQLPVGGLAGV